MASFFPHHCFVDGCLAVQKAFFWRHHGVDAVLSVGGHDLGEALGEGPRVGVEGVGAIEAHLGGAEGAGKVMT